MALSPKSVICCISASGIGAVSGAAAGRVAASQGAEVRFRQYFDDFGDDVEQGERVVTGLTG